MTAAIPIQLVLRPRRWVELPGADREVLLHGHNRGGTREVITIHRTFESANFAGWDLTRVYRSCYTRRVER